MLVVSVRPSVIASSSVHAGRSRNEVSLSTPAWPGPGRATTSCVGDGSPGAEPTPISLHSVGCGRKWSTCSDGYVCTSVCTSRLGTWGTSKRLRDSQ